MINEDKFLQQKARYRILCAEEKSIPLFSKDWWLDAVCGEHNWNVVLYSQRDEVLSSLPFYMPKPHQICMPKLCQTMGPWFKDVDNKYYKDLYFQNKAITQMLDDLPKFSYFNQYFHFSATNWLPWYWHGFNQTTRYTYRIEAPINVNSIWSEMQENIKRNIRKAESKYLLSIDNTLSVERLSTLVSKTFQRQNIHCPYSHQLLSKIVNSADRHHSHKMLFAIDRNLNDHAGVYIVWDDNQIYYLVGGADSNYRRSGAMAFLLWNAIKFAGSTGRSFDFEGSMVESIEHFFRGFGARQVPYHHVWKSGSPWLTLLNNLKNTYHAFFSR